MTIGPDLPGAVTAFNRFGFGARPGDLAAAASDPRGFLLEELWTSDIALVRDRAPLSGQALRLSRPITSSSSKYEPSK